MKTYQQLWQSLTPLYDAGEAQAIVRTVLDVEYGMTLTDLRPPSFVNGLWKHRTRT